MRVAAVALINAFAVTAFAQAQDAPPPVIAESVTVNVPAGTSFLMRLERPVPTRAAQRGDPILLHTVFAFALHDEIVIPAGTLVDATLDTIVSRGWIHRDRELRLRITRVRLASGTLGEAVRDGERGGAIGSVAGGVPAVIEIPSGGARAIEAGSALDVRLREAIAWRGPRSTTHAAARAAMAAQKARSRERRPDLACYDPGFPGTADVTIPGDPGTPAIGDFPGTPPSPPTTIPGVPPTPGFWYSCR